MSDTTATSSNVALFGKDPTPRMVAVLPLLDGAYAEQAQMRVYQRSADFQQVIATDEPFFPFFFLSDIDLLRDFPRDRFQFQPLEGSNFYRYVIVLRSWSAYWDAVRHVERAVETRERRPTELYLINNPAQQYLTQTGRTCFKDMAFDDLHRLQLDIETYSEHGFPNADRPEDEIIIVSLHDNRGWHRVLDTRAVSEKILLQELVRVLRERDPDVIETHNGYAFDFPYIMARCERHGVPFVIGRDGSVPRSFPSSMRFAERTIDFPALEIAGRHIVDTFFQVMSFDVFKRDLPGYGLKEVARYFGFAPEDRTYIPGSEIAQVWKRDPERVLAYALDDVIETERLARHLSGSTFYLTQMLPMVYGQVARTGPASKIEALFVREYLRQRHSIPKSEWGSQALGGYTDVFVTGVVGPVVYADVESLYPSIMLNYDVKPKTDELDLFPDLLRRLTNLRFDAKRQMKTSSSDDARSELDARQSSYKILINCFTPDTDVLTTEGLKRIGDLKVGDQVYSIHPETLEVEIKPIVDIDAQYYEGPMVEIKTAFVDYLVTPNHRFLTSKFIRGVYTSYSWEMAGDLLQDCTLRKLPPLFQRWSTDRMALPEYAEGKPTPSLRDTPPGRGFAGTGLKKSPPWRGAELCEAGWVSFANSNTVDTLPDNKHAAPTIEAHQCKQIPYTGMIHCVTVADHHTLLAGRNGKLNWCGQSFYGQLGFGHAAFNDFAEADRVAATGQDLLRQIIALIRRAGGLVIEVDTDGVLFVPPEDVRGDEAERAFIDTLNAEMPEGIRIGFDGRFQSMLSYKKKNYALLTYNGALKFKGSSLVSRSIERFGRHFVRKAIALLMQHDIQGLHDLYLQTRDQVIAHDWQSVRSFSRTETLKDTVEQYMADVEAGKRTRAAAYELAIQQAEATGQEPRKGDRISYYVTGSGANVTSFENSRLADAWDPDNPDENTAYYLKRLDEFARKFDAFFTEHDFRLIFSPEDLFGFSPEGIQILRQERRPSDVEDEVPF